MRQLIHFARKGLTILVDRLRNQGLRITLVWAYGRGLPKLTGVPLVRYSQVTPQVFVGGQYGQRGKRCGTARSPPRFSSAGNTANAASTSSNDSA